MSDIFERDDYYEPQIAKTKLPANHNAHPMTDIDAKGAFGGTCNRTACSDSPAHWWNPNTSKYYCTTCAFRINQYISFEMRDWRCTRHETGTLTMVTNQ